MIFEQDKHHYRVGQKLGFLFSYAMFTTILNLILAYSDKIPETWSILHTAAITAAVISLGFILQRLLR